VELPAANLVATIAGIGAVRILKSDCRSSLSDHLFSDGEAGEDFNLSVRQLPADFYVPHRDSAIFEHTDGLKLTDHFEGLSRDCNDLGGPSVEGERPIQTRYQSRRFRDRSFHR